MEAPHTPRHSGGHSTSTVSPYVPIDSESPRPRASTFAYGRMVPKTDFGPTPVGSRGSSHAPLVNRESSVENKLGGHPTARHEFLAPGLPTSPGNRFASANAGYPVVDQALAANNYTDYYQNGPHNFPQYTHSSIGANSAIGSYSDHPSISPRGDSYGPRRLRDHVDIASLAPGLVPMPAPNYDESVKTHHIGYTAGKSGSSSSTYLPEPLKPTSTPTPEFEPAAVPLTPQRNVARPVTRQISPPQRPTYTAASHARTMSAGGSNVPAVQPRRASSRTYRHETPVPGANDLVAVPTTPGSAPHHTTSPNPPAPHAPPSTHAPSTHAPPPHASPHAPVLDSRRRQKRTSIGPWDFIKSIGAGSMGQVKLASHRYTKQLAAVKVVPKAFTQRSKDSRESNEAKDARIVREAAIGRLLNHPNIAKLYDVYSMTGHFYLVFEYINGGQMLDYIIAHGCVKENQARQFGRSIASALDYCHHNSIVHRDLKIENILIADNGDIKLIDFGLSNLFRRSDRLRTFCGSLYFAAPELLNALPYVGPEIDIWSFGVVLYVLVCGKVPFEDKSMTVLHTKIKRGVVEYPPWLSSLCMDLLKHMLVVDPLERATLAEVMRHPWLNQGFASIPDAGLPRRVPLTIEAVDPLVTEEMEALGIGDALTIERSMRQVLTSPEYEHALAAWNDASLAESLGNGAAAVNGLRSSSSRGAADVLSPLGLSGNDPLDAFSPEISCYFLTKERMSRLRLNSENSLNRESVSPAPPSSEASFGGLPTKAAPNPVAPRPSPPLEMGRARAKTLGSAYEARPPAISVSPAVKISTRDRSEVGPPPQQAFVSSIPQNYSPSGPQHAQYGVMTTTASVKPINLDQNGHANVYDTSAVPNTIQLTHSHSTAGNSGHRYVSQPLPASSAGPPGLLSPSNAAPTMSSLFRKLSLRRKAGAGHSRAKSTSQAVSPPDFDTHSRISHHSDSSQISQSGMPSIESPKPVFFRGIFSVQTTSTKPLKEIRSEIIRVLQLKQIEYVEVRGGFACVARPSPSPPPSANEAAGSNGVARHRSTHSATHPSSYANTNELVPPQTPPRSAHRHRRMISDNGVMSPDLSLGSGSTDSIDMEIGASDMLGDHKSVMTVPVRFEIDIVRVPIVSLHGVQFKKMTGNVWLYKNLAQEILTALRL